MSSVTSVEFYANGSLVGTKAASPYFTVWTPTTAGSYAITAIVTDNGGMSNSSAQQYYQRGQVVSTGTLNGTGAQRNAFHVTRVLLHQFFEGARIAIAKSSLVGCSEKT